MAAITPTSGINDRPHSQPYRALPVWQPAILVAFRSISDCQKLVERHNSRPLVPFYEQAAVSPPESIKEIVELFHREGGSNRCRGLVFSLGAERFRTLYAYSFEPGIEKLHRFCSELLSTPELLKMIRRDLKKKAFWPYLAHLWGMAEEKQDFLLQSLCLALLKGHKTFRSYFTGVHEKLKDPKLNEALAGLFRLEGSGGLQFPESYSLEQIRLP